MKLLFKFNHHRKKHAWHFSHRLRTTKEIAFVHPFQKSLQKQARGCFGGLEGVGGIASQIFFPISKKIPTTSLVLTPKTTFDFGDPWERHPSRVTSNRDMRRPTIQNIRETLDDRSNLFLFCNFHFISLLSRPTSVTYITRHCTICIPKTGSLFSFHLLQLPCPWCKDVC